MWLEGSKCVWRLHHIVRTNPLDACGLLKLQRAEQESAVCPDPLYAVSHGFFKAGEATNCKALSKRWNFGNISLIPLSNCTSTSYAFRSEGFLVSSRAKSRLLKTVFLQSLHIRTSRLISLLVFSARLLVTSTC